MTYNPLLSDYYFQDHFGAETQSASATPKEIDQYDLELSMNDFPFSFNDPGFSLNKTEQSFQLLDDLNHNSIIAQNRACYTPNDNGDKVSNAEEIKTSCLVNKQSPKIKGKVISKNQASEKKNIHRYITRQIIRALVSEECRKQLELICKRLKISVDVVIEYFESKIEFFTSLSMLRDHWTVIPNNFSESNLINHAFKKFSRWFLKYRATRYILQNGRMKDKKAYLDYKNSVMMHHLKYPEKYVKNNV